MDGARHRARPCVLGLHPADAHPRRGVRRSVQPGVPPPPDRPTALAGLPRRPGRGPRSRVGRRVRGDPSRALTPSGGSALALLRVPPRRRLARPVHDLQRRVEPAALPRCPDQWRGLPVQQRGLRLRVGRRPAPAAGPRRQRGHRDRRHPGGPRHHPRLPRPGGAQQAPAHHHRRLQRRPLPATPGARRAAACALGRPAGRLHRPRRRGPDGPRRDRGLHLEGHARLRHVHRVRSMPVDVPGLEHRQAAVTQAPRDVVA